jgi:hypothetical protein
MLRNNAISVIPACPESFPPQRKDSGQAGMTMGLHFSLRPVGRVPTRQIKKKTGLHPSYYKLAF